MKKHILFLLIFSLCLPALAQADITTTFDEDLEDWKAVNAEASHVAEGGNPGGYMEVQDKSGPKLSFVAAPDKYKGDLSPYNNGTLSFDLLFITSPVVNDERYGTVGIFGQAGGAAYADLVTGTPMGNNWHSYSTELNSGLWNVNGNWDNILSNVKNIAITLDEGTTDNTSGLDNFSVAVVPEPVSSVLFIAGAATLGFRQYRKKTS